ncbi:OBF-binding protein 3 [Striga asiatica]|uniref:OBF-binding protein 3 n=1 Tax=Striga asiatica TaxID=4170 RepID=A0A5A7P5A8_STRAF|nr:OBF-binding protein 3 [Striga asiatica]
MPQVQQSRLKEVSRDSTPKNKVEEGSQPIESPIKITSEGKLYVEAAEEDFVPYPEDDTDRLVIVGGNRGTSGAIVPKGQGYRGNLSLRVEIAGAVLLDHGPEETRSQSIVGSPINSDARRGSPIGSTREGGSFNEACSWGFVVSRPGGGFADVRGRPPELPVGPSRGAEGAA